MEHYCLLARSNRDKSSSTFTQIEMEELLTSQTLVIKEKVDRGNMDSKRSKKSQRLMTLISTGDKEEESSFSL